MVIATVDCFCSFALFCFLFVLVCFVENYILFAGEDEPWSVFELTLLLFVENAVSALRWVFGVWRPRHPMALNEMLNLTPFPWHTL